jgi:hypothetical protein
MLEHSAAKSKLRAREGLATAVDSFTTRRRSGFKTKISSRTDRRSKPHGLSTAAQRSNRFELNEGSGEESVSKTAFYAFGR